MMPCSTSCSRVLLCCRQSWRTVREQRHGGQGGNCHRPKPNPLSHLAAICGFNHQTCQDSNPTKCLLFPDQSATSKKAGRRASPQTSYPLPERVPQVVQQLDANTGTSLAESCSAENETQQGVSSREKYSLMFNATLIKGKLEKSKTQDHSPVNVKYQRRKTHMESNRLVFKKGRSMKQTNRSIGFVVHWCLLGTQSHAHTHTHMWTC